MNTSQTKLFEVAQRIKTPLALAGAVLIVFYLIVKQVLSLKVFENIGSEATASFLQDLLQKVFWLAIVAICLGMISYVLALILGHKTRARESNVELVDARLDPHSSDYEELPSDAGRKIRPKHKKQGHG